ncbi:hypothetical protein P7C71_g4429, partial [Lecanoromycetidae sp. Uapishka_2]
MDKSLLLFQEFTKLEELRYVPIVILLNKWDLFKQRIVDTPISDTFPHYCGSMGAVTACNFFADEFVKRDERPDGTLRIFNTSAVDSRVFKDTLEQIRPLLVQNRPSSPSKKREIWSLKWSSPSSEKLAGELPFHPGSSLSMRSILPHRGMT